ncbi:hypothetical protein HPP92_015725 [Vanilla planifolia]|uniref:Uncharacterized protein n=1 Tax=Vanilla planifolia TaxID=51239 RepID=A0A835QK81_VANPL|nr:hypothetical protein HPP92_015725 [Vanilla planifolia]
MEELFNMDELDQAFGGKSDAEFDIKEYANRMREDDKKRLVTARNLVEIVPDESVEENLSKSSSLDEMVANRDELSEGDKHQSFTREI